MFVCVCAHACKSVDAFLWVCKCVHVWVGMLACGSGGILKGGGAIITANKTTTNKKSLFWASPCCTTPLHKPYFTRATDTENVLRCAA